ncbi:MAG TPA: response regulator [Syntrophorhabdaceae bacterium]|nr:response regulator [Syntrophorhabdaceae bacterium]
MMKKEDLQNETMRLQWNFYERAINNYSIIMRIMSSVEEDILVSYIPRVFVEESFFDMCKVMVDDDGIIREGFYSIDETLHNLDFTSISAISGSTSMPSLVDDVFGYGILYVYPLRKELKKIGYLVLGKRYYMEVEMRLVRELEIVCEIFNRSLLLSESGHRKELHSSATFSTVLEEFPDPFLLIDKKGYVCYVNKKAREEFETKKGFLVGERVDRVIPGLPEDLVKKSGIIYGEVNYKSKNDYKVFKVESFAVKEEKDKGEWRAVLFKNVMKKKVSEEEHLLKKRMESVGMLAGGIAHDFNNMLTGILGYSSLMKKALASDAKLERYAEAIEHSAQRASKLTRHLLNFSRRQKKSSGLVDINALLDDVLFLLKESIRDIQIEIDLENGLPHIKGDEAELQNVFLNLLINARDAMNGRGLLNVTTKMCSKPGGREFIHIEIEDTGKGIDEALRSKIFEPYFSTKEGDSNLGMGLYLVDKAVKGHGGFIEVASEKDKGTVFGLYFPVPRTRSAVQKKKAPIVTNGLIRERSILIVDDEHMIRDLLKGALAETGVSILEADSGEEALSIFKTHREEIDLVILDVIMPGIKGDEVLREIRKAVRDARVVISSGFMSEEQRAKLQEYKVDGFLDKPFKDQDVLEIVAKMLSEEGS